MRNGQHDGKVLWICDYNQPDPYKKPLRCVAPTKVMVKSNFELPKNKRVYYSDSHFSPINAKGTVLRKIIKPVDQTGHRSYIGNELHVFDTEVECNDLWDALIDKACDVFDDLIANSAARWQKEKNAMIARKVNNL